MFSSSHHFKCGTYQQLGYWANNFDDFAVSISIYTWWVFIKSDGSDR